jgi:hypothetical protein
MEATGKKDVWKKVIWRGKEAYIRSSQLYNVSF